MGLIKLEKGQTLHRAGKDIVETVEVVVKGTITISNSFSSITLGVGGFIGVVETPGMPYVYDIEAAEEAAVFSYPFNSMDDIPKVVALNPKIAPILAAQSVDAACLTCDAFEKEFSDAYREYAELSNDYADYPSLCIKVGEKPRSFPEMEELDPPRKSGNLPDWSIAYVRSLKKNEEQLKKSLYPLSLDVATGIVMSNISIFQKVSTESQLLSSYRKAFNIKTKEFRANIQGMKAKQDDFDNGVRNSEANIAIVNALNTILHYSEVSAEIGEMFEQQLAAFKADNNRYDSADDRRQLRKNIASSFFKIYVPALIKSFSDDNVPIELKMFFMFGFVDEDLAGERNTALLCNMARSYVPDSDGNVLLLCEWLKKIYDLDVMPSKNEFDEDWPTYLREQKANGNISEEKMLELMDDPKSRLDFEVHNLFSLGNRMTFGRISVYVPVFDEQNILKPLDAAYQNYSKINEYFENIRDVDYSVFCRQAVYSNTEIGITQIYYSDDITPYMILMPNIGSRACLWQEIDGKKRSTKARMLLSIFNTENNTEDAMIRLFGEFRWEMCKTVQGVHWNDITDPSLTSMYCDYLQFFKKNSALSSENKEKLRTDLKKFSNNYKNVFIADYLQYIKFEALSSPRLNKVARDILFTFCPFSKKVRERLSDNPQYTELINRFNFQTGNQLKPLSNLVHRLEKEEIELPEEVKYQIDFLHK